MERLTDFELEQIDNQLINDGTDTQVRKLVDEVKEYRKLEEELGCPLEVRCKLCDGTLIYDKDGKSMVMEHIGEHDFYAVPIERPHIPRLMYIKGYKKTWWLKADKSE